MAEGKGLRGSTHLELYKLEGWQPAGSDRAMIPHHQQRANIVGNNDIGASKTFRAFFNHIINFYLTRPDLSLKLCKSRALSVLVITFTLHFFTLVQYLTPFTLMLYTNTGCTLRDLFLCKSPSICFLSFQDFSSEKC